MIGDTNHTRAHAELAKRGDFGIGTLNGLDGETVEINGVFYQIPIDGKPRHIGSAEKTPFAVVTFFEADQNLQVDEAINYSALKAYIDQNISPENAMYAIKVHGVYDYAKTRSVSNCARDQTIFTLSNVTGTTAGFRLPSYMNEINV